MSNPFRNLANNLVNVFDNFAEEVEDNASAAASSVSNASHTAQIKATDIAPSPLKIVTRDICECFSTAGEAASDAFFENVDGVSNAASVCAQQAKLTGATVLQSAKVYAKTGYEKLKNNENTVCIKTKPVTPAPKLTTLAPALVPVQASVPALAQQAEQGPSQEAEQEEFKNLSSVTAAETEGDEEYKVGAPPMQRKETNDITTVKTSSEEPIKGQSTTESTDDPIESQSSTESSMDNILKIQFTKDTTDNEN